MADIITLFGAFMYGLTSSVSMCLASCLPVYLPILAGYGDDVKKGVKLSLGFALGRYAGYFLLGTVAALMGAAFLDFFENQYPNVSGYVVLLFGALTVVLGVLMLSKAKISFFGRKTCRTYFGKVEKFANPMVGAMALGFISTITPCVPVFTFLLLPFAIGKVWETAFVTIAFGLGANVVFIAIAVAMALGVKGINTWFQSVKRKIEVFSAFTLIAFGAFYILWALGPQLFGWGNKHYVLPTAFDFIDLLRYLIGV